MFAEWAHSTNEPFPGSPADPVGLIVLDEESLVVTLCERCLNLFGCEPGHAEGQPIARLLPGFPALPAAGAAPRARTPIRQVLEATDLMALRRDGTAFPATVRVFEDEAKPARRRLAVVTDLAARKRQTEEILPLVRALNQTADLVMVTDAAGHIVYVNPAFEGHTGYSLDEVVGLSPSLLKSGRQSHEFYGRMWATLQSGGVFRGILVNRKKNGELFHEEKTITPVKDPSGRIVNYVSTAKDVTDRVRAEERLVSLANFDPLTGLPNRNLFNDRLQQALARSRREGRRGALLYLDLDRFKEINDTHGHEVGDRVLASLGPRLRITLRDEDTVARIGGDEFAFILNGLDAAASAEAVAEKLLALCREPILIDGNRHFVSGSIGITLFPDHGAESSTLLRNADIAMYRAKSAGRTGHEVFAAPMAEAIGERHHMESLLRDALAKDEFFLHYQPQVELASGRVVGVEALLRWRSPALGLVPANTFVPVLEASGLIVDVGRWVLHEALREARALGHLAPGARLTVNISGRQFKDAGFLRVVEGALGEGANGEVALDFEITESLLMDDLPLITSRIAHLDRLGIRLAIDDFGTGYSSLSYLRHFPIHVLKIDRSFVADCDRDEKSASIVNAIIHLARSLGLRTVAEGVETREQCALLSRLGCDAVQGFYFRRPAPLAEALAGFSPAPLHAHA